MKESHKKNGSIRFIFCSDEDLLTINQTFLKHDYYTDIITFDLTSTAHDALDAEIYISVDRVKDNANKIGDSLQKELHRVVFHGLLHLCGYNDKKRNQTAAMRLKEEEYLALYF